MLNHTNVYKVNIINKELIHTRKLSRLVGFIKEFYLILRACIVLMQCFELVEDWKDRGKIPKSFSEVNVKLSIVQLEAEERKKIINTIYNVQTILNNKNFQCNLNFGRKCIAWNQYRHEKVREPKSTIGHSRTQSDPTARRTQWNQAGESERMHGLLVMKNPHRLLWIELRVLKRWFSGLEHLLFMKRIWVQFLLLPEASSRDSKTLLWPPWAHTFLQANT